MYNINAETEVLGKILYDNDSICGVIDFLKEQDFYLTNHKNIYGKMKSMYEKNMPIEVVTLSEELGDALIDVGGITYLSSLYGSVINSKNIDVYGKIVKEKSDLRKVAKLLKENLEKIKKDSVKAEEIASDVEKNILDISETEEEMESIGDILKTVLKDIKKRRENKGAIQGISTGLEKLDKLTNGLNKNEFIVIAARPSMGKTALALNLALTSAIKGEVTTAFFNLEMSKDSILERALSIKSGVEMNKIKKGNISEAEMRSFKKIGEKLNNSKLKMFDKKFTLSSIKAQCKKLKIQEDLKVVIIDYLQLIEIKGRFENKNVEISNISRELKLMAKELGITVIALSQLSRAPESRLEHRPMLSDLRDSGGIEQDADTVMFLYRDEYYNINTEDKNVIECIVAKQRNGEVGTVKLKWIPQCQKVLSF